MQLARYPVVTRESPYVYTFISEGSKGKIAKGIFYTRIGENLYNLGFGDLNEDFSDLCDSSRSNNGDRNKVLTTVAFTALDFTSKFPDAAIFIEGSTPARTRLYQMGIAANLMEINESFVIQGFADHLWEVFEPGRNYEAFLVSRK